MEFILNHDEESSYYKVHKYKQMSDDAIQTINPGFNCLWSLDKKKCSESMYKPLKFSQIVLKILAISSFWD